MQSFSKTISSEGHRSGPELFLFRELKHWDLLAQLKRQSKLLGCNGYSTALQVTEIYLIGFILPSVTRDNLLHYSNVFK